MDKPIKESEAREAFRLVNSSKHGSIFTQYLFQRLMLGETLRASDPRVQEGNVALHDLGIELQKMLN